MKTHPADKCQSSTSIIYIFLYLLTARRSSISTSIISSPSDTAAKHGPPDNGIQIACFVVLRVAMFIWIAASVGAVVAVINMPECGKKMLPCRLQMANTVVSWSSWYVGYLLIISYFSYLNLGQDIGDMAKEE
jgi:hypothetical protein